MNGAEEGELQPDVQDGPDQHRRDNGQRDVTTRVAGFPSELDGLLEALVSEDYAPGGYSAQNARDPERGEAALGGKVGGVEGHDERTMTARKGIAIFQI